MCAQFSTGGPEASDHNPALKRPAISGPISIDEHEHEHEHDRGRCCDQPSRRHVPDDLRSRHAARNRAPPGIGNR
jgi:hypothetical protein